MGLEHGIGIGIGIGKRMAGYGLLFRFLGIFEKC